MHIGQKLRYEGGVEIVKIIQPYNLDGSMAEPIVELSKDGELWGYLTVTAVGEIERYESRDV